MNINRYKKVCFFLIPLLFIMVLLAEAGVLLVFSAQAATVREEINDLIEFIERSGCIFSRNGTDYQATDAVKHIIKKYEYYRGKIDSAETFIDLAASRSEWTKMPYVIKCADLKPIKSKDWLMEQLKRIRNSRINQVTGSQ